MNIKSGQRFYWISMACICLVPLLSTGCSQAAGAHVHQNPDPIPTVAVVRVAMEPIMRQSSLEAELEPYQEVDIRGKVAGYVQSITVDIGSRVRKGQLLALLEVPELQSDRDQADATVRRRDAEAKRAQDQLNVAQAVYQFAHLTYQRLSKVNEEHPGMVAGREVDDALGHDQQAEAQVSADRAALAAAQASLREAISSQGKEQAILDYARITAPFDGVITKRYVHTGAMVPAGTSSQATPVVRIAQTDPLRLVIYVPASLVRNVQIGKHVTIRVPAAGKTFDLPISRMQDAVDLASRTMRIEVDVPNRDMALASGEYAQAELSLERKDNALVVPAVAVIHRRDQASLWVVNAAHCLELRTVALGIESASKVEIVSGVSEGDAVAIGQTGGFQAGEKVNVKTIEHVGVEGGS